MQEGSVYETALYIVLAVLAALILIIAVLLFIPIRAYVSYFDGKFDFKVKYLWFKLYELNRQKKQDSQADTPSQSFEISETDIHNVEKKPESPPDNKAAKNVSDISHKESDKSGSSDGQPDETKKKESLTDKWNEIKIYIPLAKKAFRKLLKLIRLRKLEAYITVGGDDPYSAGMNFARANQAFYPALGLLCCLFNVKIKKTQLSCNYEKSELNFSGGVVVTATPAGILALAIYLLINYLRIKKERRTNNER